MQWWTAVVLCRLSEEELFATPICTEYEDSVFTWFIFWFILISFVHSSEWLQELGWEPSRVSLENDTNAALLAEADHRWNQFMHLGVCILHCQHGSISWLFIIIYNVIYIYIHIYERHKIMQNMILHDITDIPVTGFLFHSNGRGVSSCSWQYLQDSAKGELQVCRRYPCFPSSFSLMMGKQSLPDALCCCKEKTSRERLWNAILYHPGYCRPWNESAGTRRIDNSSCTTVLSSLCGCLSCSTTVIFPCCFFFPFQLVRSSLVAAFWGLDRSCGWHEACWELRDSERHCQLRLLDYMKHNRDGPWPFI